MAHKLVHNSAIPEHPEDFLITKAKPFDLNEFLRIPASVHEKACPRVSSEIKAANSLGGFSPECVNFIRCGESEYSFEPCVDFLRRKWRENRFLVPGTNLYRRGPIAYFTLSIFAELMDEPCRRTLWWWNAKLGITSLLALGTICHDPMSLEQFAVRIRIMGGEWVPEKIPFGVLVRGSDRIELMKKGWYAEEAGPPATGFVSGEDYAPYL